MGIARVSCWGTCTCIDHVVDGHIDSKEGTRKVTVFTEHTFEAALSHLDADNVTNEQCGVTVLVTNASSSGGHIFKIRDILLHVSASTCDVDRVTRHFLSVRLSGPGPPNVRNNNSPNNCFQLLETTLPPPTTIGYIGYNRFIHPLRHWLAHSAGCLKTELRSECRFRERSQQSGVPDLNQ